MRGDLQSSSSRVLTAVFLARHSKWTAWSINDTKRLSDLAFLLQKKLHNLVVISLTRLLKIDYYIGTVKRPFFTFSKPFPG